MSKVYLRLSTFFKAGTQPHWLVFLALLCLQSSFYAHAQASNSVSGTVSGWGAQAIAYVQPGTEFIAISAGGDHTLALKSDGAVVAWGDNYYGQCASATVLSEVTALASGASHSLVLKSNGTVVAWGLNDHGQSILPIELGSVFAIAAGDSHSLVLKSDGAVVAWGLNDRGQSAVPSGLTGVTAIAAGVEHSLALKSDGTVIAWGSNDYNQSAVPSGLSGVIAVAAGGWHSLALRSDGTVVAWGYNGYGQRNVPSGLSGVIAVAAGWSHSLALKSDGSVVAWGGNFYGQCAVPANLNGIIAISAGRGHSVALKSDGTLTSWGWEYFGQSIAPNDLKDIAGIATGYGHSLALKRDGTVRQWGWYAQGQYAVPTNLTGVIAVSARNSHNLALKSDGRVVAWGWNEYGQATVPNGLSNVTSIAAGAWHSLALRSNGTVVGWGYNGHGQSTIPNDLNEIIAVAAGWSHSLALRSNGTVVAWGDNAFRQSSGPTDLTAVVAVAAGNSHSLALKSDGTVVAWGNNAYGQTSLPSGLNGVVAITAGWAHSLALKSDGTVVAWGYNAYDQSMVPSGLSGAVAIISGWHHNLALLSQTARLLHSLTLSGSSQVLSGNSMTLQCLAQFSSGTTKNVSTEASWSIVGNKPEGTFFSGNILQAGFTETPFPVQIQARYTEGGETRTSDPFTVTILPRFSVSIAHTISFIGNPHIGWSVNLQATASGIDPATVTFDWDLDDNGFFDDATGYIASKSFFGDSGTRRVSIRATAPSGTQVIARQFVTLNKPPVVDEPPEKIIPPDPVGGVVRDSLGNPFAFDPTRIANGLVIVTHGLWQSEDAEWLNDLASAVEARFFFDGKPSPNVCVFGWQERANPSAFIGVDDLTSALLRWIPFYKGDHAWKNIPLDLALIRTTAEAQGSDLANWIREQVKAGNIDRTKPIHLIGHSAGGFVMGECAAVLKKLESDPIHVAQVTMLDTPHARKRHVEVPTSSPSPGKVDRYITSFFGGTAPELELRGPFYLVTPGPNYYRKEVSGGPLLPLPAHSYAHEWYWETVSLKLDDGFHYSPFFDNVFPTVGGRLSRDGLQFCATDESEETVALSTFGTFGNVTVATNDVYTITEESNAGIFQALELPIGAQSLKFQYKFSTAGDGDFLSVHWGTNVVLYIGPDLEISRENFIEAEVSVAEFATETNQLVFKLVSRGVTNAVLVLDQIALTISDDPDHDGLTTEEELVLGTNPLGFDTDEDGLRDGDEINIHDTNPVLADTDGDGMPDGAEIRAGTNPNDASSALRITGSDLSTDGYVTLRWQGVTNRTYRVHRSFDVSGLNYSTLATNLPGKLPTTSFTDQSSTTNKTRFFWVEIE